MAGRLKETMYDPFKETPVAPDFFLTREKETLGANCMHLLSVTRPALPIIMVPGIMASRLGNVESGLVAWDPDGGLDTWNKFKKLNPEQRYELLAQFKKRLVPMNFDVDFKGVKHCKETFAEDYPHGEKRGWGGVYWGGYGDLLQALDDWSTPLKVLVDLPVYAFGYNWMDDNKNSGKHLTTVIKKVRDWHKAKHVLLVTHSMGGMVARAACKLYGAEGSVYGIVHGAQPVLGAPDAYRRMIAGEMGGFFMNSIMSSIIGPTGPHITAVLPHSIGGLELLPIRQYTAFPPHIAVPEGIAAANQWLHLVTIYDGGRKQPGDMDELVHYPKTGDPYSEIYLKGLGQTDSKEKVYWRLLREEWIQPQNTVHAVTGEKTTDDKAIQDMQEYIMAASDFHNALDANACYCHPLTVQLYSADPAREKGEESGANRTFCEIVWETREQTAFVKKLCREIEDNPESISRPDFPIGRFLAQSNWKGSFQELILLKKGEPLTETSKPYTDKVTSHLFRPGEKIYRIQQEGGRIFTRRLLLWGEESRGYPRWENGDSTVPETSAQGLTPIMDKWPDECLFHVSQESSCKKKATFRPNQAGHASFFDENAILATKNALYNMILAWIHEHGKEKGAAFDCDLQCIRPAAEQSSQTRGE